MGKAKKDVMGKAKKDVLGVKSSLLRCGFFMSTFEWVERRHGCAVNL